MAIQIKPLVESDFKAAIVDFTALAAAQFGDTDRETVVKELELLGPMFQVEQDEVPVAFFGAAEKSAVCGTAEVWLLMTRRVIGSPLKIIRVMQQGLNSLSYPILYANSDHKLMQLLGFEYHSPLRCYRRLKCSD